MQPRNWFERLLFLHGRKFYLAMFGGASSFVLAGAGMWIAARVTPDTARIVESIVSAYMLSAAAMVTAYSATNAAVDWGHAKHGATPPPRMSGAMTPMGE
jgi:hypothetical protein